MHTHLESIPDTAAAIEPRPAAVPGIPAAPVKESGTAATPRPPSLRRRLLHFYLLQLARIWAHLPRRARAGYAGHAFGRHLHAVVCRLSDRQQYFATYFLRNRPELEQICRLVGSRPHGSSVRLSVLACSKGAEVYSIAWAIRSARPDLRLSINAVDISGEIVEFAGKGVYSLAGFDSAAAVPPPAEASSDVARNTHRDQGAPIFERMTAAEVDAMCELQGGQAIIRPWLREGITWMQGDAGAPDLVARLGRQDIVVANRFLCHMSPPVAEACLRNIAALVAPGGYLFVTGIDLDVRAKVARSLQWKPVAEAIREIHEGDVSLSESWPLEYWALEPFRDDLPGWDLRYASVFQIG